MAREFHRPPNDTGYWRKIHVATGAVRLMLVRAIPGAFNFFEAQFTDDPSERWYRVSKCTSKLWMWAEE